jgi:sporulation integral membrane protein YtvI
MYLFAVIFNVAKPVFVALLIYLLIEPAAKFLNRKLRIKKPVAATISLFLLVLLLFAFIITIGILIFTQLRDFSAKLPGYLEFLQTEANSLIEQYSHLLDNLSPDLVVNLTNYFASLSGTIVKFFENIFFSLINSVGSISSWVITIVLAIVLAFFLSIEIETWERFAKKNTPKTFKNGYYFLKENVLKGIGVWFKAQLKLMTITFILVLIGLLILRVDGALTIAFFAGLLDLLPVLGVSTIFIPWIIYLIVIGDLMMALYLGIIFVIIVVVRQLLEPKITGESLGVSPFIMLSFMLISLAIFGFVGLLLAPILLVTLKSLIDQGYLRKWVKMPEGELDYQVNSESQEEEQELKSKISLAERFKARFKKKSTDDNSEN